MACDERPGEARSAPERVTWAVLLGHWIDFARSALALPDDAEGRRLRDSVPDIIMLQAVWFALQHLDELDVPERALGIDRAEVLIERHRAALEARWQCQGLPGLVHELVDDALRQLASVGPR
jgi:hypothetical protein